MKAFPVQSKLTGVTDVGRLHTFYQHKFIKLYYIKGISHRNIHKKILYMLWYKAVRKVCKH